MTSSWLMPTGKGPLVLVIVVGAALVVALLQAAIRVPRRHDRSIDRRHVKREHHE